MLIHPSTTTSVASGRCLLNSFDKVQSLSREVTFPYNKNLNKSRQKVVFPPWLAGFEVNNTSPLNEVKSKKFSSP